MRVVFLFFLFFISYSGWCQTFEASANASTVVENATFSVEFTLKNGRGSNFRSPNFEGLRMISGPNTSSSTTIINGKMSSSISYSFQLMAMKEGTYKVGSASIQSGGKLLSTQPFLIKVVKGREGGGATKQGGDVFVRAEVSTDSAYVGQQILLSLKLYTQINVERYDLAYQPEFEDVFVKPLPNNNRKSQMEVVDGQQYSTQVLTTYALYPQKSGKYQVDGYLVRLGIPDKSQKNRGFFFSSQLQMRNVKTNDIAFEVVSLPEPKPVSFSGGVGRYKVGMKSDRTRLSTDDALSLVVDISGTGDERMLYAPDLNLGEDFEMYDANEITPGNTGRQLSSTFTKKFEYLIIPRHPGRQWLKPEFSYFDLDSNAYVTMIIDSVLLDVTKGTSESKALRKFEEDQKVELAPITRDWNGVSPKTYWLDSVGYWLAWGLILLLTVGLMILKVRKDREDEMDGQTKRFMKAKKKAEEKLKVAHGLMSTSDDQRFYEQLALGIKQYLGDKLRVDPAHFTKANIHSHLMHHGASEGLTADVQSLLSDCDIALFAPGMAPDKESAYDRAVRIVMELEEVLNKHS